MMTMDAVTDTQAKNEATIKPAYEPVVISERNKLRLTWACWIASLAVWEWFCNLTFKNPVHPEAAGKIFKLWITDINKAIFGIHSKYCIPWVKAIEHQKRGVIHFHALLSGGVKQLDVQIYKDRWLEYAGFSSIYEKVTEGAIPYITKYILKGGKIDLYIPGKGIQKSLSLY